MTAERAPELPPFEQMESYLRTDFFMFKSGYYCSGSSPFALTPPFEPDIHNGLIFILRSILPGAFIFYPF